MKELEYFMIENSYGGNQDWFSNIVMRIGGCAAATACDCSIYFALRNGMRNLYPYDLENLTQQSYKDFSQMMKPYIRPRMGGVKNPQWFIDGFQSYISDVNEREGTSYRINMDVFLGTESFEAAKAFIRTQLDEGTPVPYLLLRHQVPKYKDYAWHWFLLTGYEEQGEDLLVKTATYGESDTFSLKEMWDTGHEEKGGMIRLIPLYES